MCKSFEFERGLVWLLKKIKKALKYYDNERWISREILTDVDPVFIYYITLLVIVFHDKHV